MSGWLARYDFASPVRDHLWSEGAGLVGRDTVIAVDSGDISKEFGGAGMEMGYDTSHGVVTGLPGLTASSNDTHWCDLFHGRIMVYGASCEIP